MRKGDADRQRKGGKKTLQISKKGGKGDGQKGGDKRQKKVLGRKPGKGGRFGKKGGKPLPKDPQSKADALDKELEGYWVKGGHVEIGKCTHLIPLHSQALTRLSFSANQRLDDDLDNYFKQSEAAVAGAAEAAKAAEPAAASGQKQD